MCKVFNLTNGFQFGVISACQRVFLIPGYPISQGTEDHVYSSLHSKLYFMNIVLLNNCHFV